MGLRINMLALLLVTGATLTVAATDAQAQLLNGNFATNGGAGQLTVNTSLTNWTGGGKEGFFGSATTPPGFCFFSGHHDSIVVFRRERRCLYGQCQILWCYCRAE